MREKVARIIDPQTFELIDHYNGLSYRGSEFLSNKEKEAATFRAYPDLKERRDAAYAKADQIIDVALEGRDSCSS